MRVEVNPTSQALSSIPFDPSINAVFLGQLTGAPLQTNAEHVIKWDPVAQQYETAFKADGFGDQRDGFWLEDDLNFVTSSLTLRPGEGFWIDNRQAVTQTVYLAGAVNMAPTGTIVFLPGLNTFAYPYSASIQLNDTTLAADGAFAGTALTNADT